MSLAERYATFITSRSRLVVVVVLLITALVGAGAAIETPEDDGIGEFETGSEEEAASEVIEAQYETDEQVVAQVVVREPDGDGDVLTRDSLLEGLRLQRDIRNDAELNATLEESIGLENVVATAARAEDIAQRREALEQRRSDLEAQRVALEAGLDETRALQREYAAVNASLAAGEVDEDQYAARVNTLEREFERVEANATAGLDADQRAAYADVLAEARSLEATRVDLEGAAEAGNAQEQRTEIEDAFEDVYAAGTVGVLGEEFETLEDDVDALEADTDTLGEGSIDDQIDALDSRSDADVEALLADVLDPDADRNGEDPYEFLPTDYEPGSTTADARITVLVQNDDSGPDAEPDAAYDAQVAIDERANERFADTTADAFVFGQGIVDEASTNAVGDSFAIITPVALVLVLFVLGITYRDVVDILLALFGIAVVMVWLAGLRGWLAIPSSQLLIAVPFLLIGLGVDYALHVVMRYREIRSGTADQQRLEGDGGTGTNTNTTPRHSTQEHSVPGPRTGMRRGLAGVVLALTAATVSTAVGFLSNYVSPLPAIQNFALLSAGGIVATFIAFAVFVPALKVELDTLLEKRFHRDRHGRPFGVDTGIANCVLGGGVTVIRHAPIAVVAVSLLLAAGGAYAGAGIDTEFNQADFLPEDAPDWAQSLPEPLAPGTYTVAADAEYIGDTFAGQDTESQILIRGDVTDPETLAAIDAATDDVDGEQTIDVRADGEPAVDSPVSTLNAIADEDETVATALETRDTTGDGLPDEDLDGLYDIAFDADEDAMSTVVARSDGEYDSARVIVSVRGDASAQAVADDTRSLASSIETDAPATATATGGPVTNAVIQDALLETLVQAFVVTLVVILCFLTVLYWLRHRTLSLGVITLTPVVIALCWLLGTMALLGIPFNSETAVITSLAIGLGVDYSIHVGERFVAESDRQPTLSQALTTTVTGTGGALLGSAATTAAGFGVLALALAPPLQRFGLVTGLSIIFAFVACVTVLPCLLVLRARLFERLA